MILRTLNNRGIAVCLAVLACLGAGRARAAVIHWNGSSSGLYDDPTNWVGGVTPGVNDVPDFSNAGTYTVTFGSNTTNDGFGVDQGTVTFALSGLTWTLDLAANQSIGALTGQTARATFSHGIVNATAGGIAIGVTADDTGFMTVTTDAVITTAGQLLVGSSGTGTLTIQNGGDVVNNLSAIIGSNSTSLGTATVSGAGSTWTSTGFTVGGSGNGSLAISGGGAVTATSGASFTTIGNSAGSEGTLTVSGASSTFSAVHELRVAGTGVGSMAISSGGAVSNTSGVIGNLAGGIGTVTVAGAGSTWTNSLGLTVGGGGTGELNITSGGTVSSINGTVGSTAGSHGSVLIDGNGSSWTVSSGGTFIGTSGTGAVTVSNGGSLITNGSSLGLATGVAASSGTLIVTGPGSTVSALSTPLSVGTIGTGALSILDGGVVSSQSGAIGNGAGGIGTATISGSGSTWNSGNLIVGSATGGNAALTVGGGGTVNAGSVTLVEPAGAATATLTINTGGMLNATGGLSRGAGTLVFNGGLLHVSGGTFSNGAVATGLTIEGATLSDLPTLRLSGSASTSNIATLTVGNTRQGAVEVLGGARLATSAGLLGGFVSATGTVSVDGAGSAWTFTNGINVGVIGGGLLNVTGGGQVIGPVASIGGSVSSTANVDGAVSLLSASDTLSVGGISPATLNITAGGRAVGTTTIVADTGGTVGVVNISGAGSTLQGSTLRVGDDGTGTINVSGGGVIDAAGGTVSVALNPPLSSGAITLTGAGSSMTANVLNIGAANSGQATVSVLSGAALTVTGGLNLNDPAGAANGVLTIDGGTVNVAGGLVRRGTLNFNDGTLSILGGNFDNGAVATPLVINGATSAAHPTLRFTGSSTATHLSDLTIGQNHTGSLYVEAGSVALVENNLFIGADPGGSGDVRVEGLLEAFGTLAVGGDATPGGKGTLSIGPGGEIIATNLTVFPQGTIEIDGGFMVIEGALTPGGGLIHFNSGVVSLTLPTVLGPFELDLLLGPNHQLIGGQSLEAFGQLTLQGDLTVAGGLLFTNDNLIVDGLLEVNRGTVKSNSGAVINAGRTLALAGGEFKTDLAMTNNGQIVLLGPSARLTGNGSLINNGLIVGDGQIDRPLINNAGGQVRVGGGQRLWFSGTAAHSNAGLVDVNGGTVEFAAALNNAASTGLVAVRDAVLRFNGGLTNNGSLTVTTGISDVYGDIINSASGRIVVSGGGFATFYDDVANAGSINVSKAGTLTSTAVFFGSLSGNGVAGAGNVFLEGDARPGFSPGTMAFGGEVSFGPFSKLAIEISGLAPGVQFDRVTVAGGLFLDGTLNVSLINGFSPAVGNSFDILDWNTLGGTFSQTVLSALAPGLSWDASNLYTTGVLSIAPLEFQWAVNASGLWSVGANWSTGVEPNGAGVPVRFGSVITAPRVVTLDAPRTAGVITFDNPNGYTIAGPNQLTLDGPVPAINVVQGSHTISTPLSIAAGRPLVVQGPGSLTLSGSQNHGAGATLSIASGTLNLNADGGSNLTIANGATLNMGASQHLAGLGLGPAAIATLTAGGNKVLLARDLTIAATAALDLTNNDAVVQANAITRAAVLGDVAAHIATGFNAFAWNGPGIRSSAAAGDANLLTALGVMLNDNGLGGAYYASFAGEAVNANSILVKYTYYGDADLSGSVDGTDYALIDNGFNAGLVGWFNGDFDYSGAIDGTDYALIDNAFNSQSGPLGAPAVPEPGAALLLACAGLLLPLARHRKHRYTARGLN